MSQSTREEFWSWYVRSARSDGASVSPFRRTLDIVIRLGLLVGWYVWMARSDQRIGRLLANLAVSHPLYIGGVVLAMVAMGFRGTSLDYMAYSIFAVEHVKFPRGIFGNETNVRAKYEQIFGRDSFRRVPELWGGLSLLLFFVSALSMVLSQR